MTPNTPLADALMLKICDQYPHESEERHRKRFMELVRNGDPRLREEIAKSLFAIYSTPHIQAAHSTAPIRRSS